MSIRKHGCGCGCFHSILSLILSLVIIAAVVLTVREAFYQYTYPVKYASYVEDASAELGVPETLIYATIQVESHFDPEARSEVGARGLMQITEETFEWLRTKETFGSTLTFADLDKPDIAINYGTYFLKLLLEEFDGDVPTAMAAYHAGRGSVHSWLEQGKYSSNGETLDEIPKDDTAYYVQKIQRAMGVYEKRLKEQKNENENVHRLRANFAKFVDAYVVPLLDSFFDRFSGSFANKLQSLTYLAGAGR
ncbi:MAG: lytic transglycosylase domain-containing protein [Acutalibacteraceae bacterium]|nr:lytic transglycosylase domain-containing protein [Acutalibacteraceae bacterium]